MNKLNRKTTFFITIMLLATYIGLAISNNDLESWSSIALEYKPDKKLTFGLEGELRFKNNITDIDQYFTHLNVDYEIFENFEIGGGIRFIRNNDLKGKIQGFENHLRYNLDLSYKHKTGPILFKHRLRYQNKNELGVSTIDGDSPNKHLRFKTSLTWKIKNWKLDPVFSAEIFRYLGDDTTNKFDKYRFTLGTNYKIKSLGKIGLFYRNERTLNEIIKKNVNIIMFKYTFTF